LEGNYNEKTKETLFDLCKKVAESLAVSDSISILVVGKSGTGKSTLINAILGEEVAHVDDNDTGTTQTQLYKCKISILHKTL
jgi:predicted GTPase